MTSGWRSRASQLLSGAGSATPVSQSLLQASRRHPKRHREPAEAAVSDRHHQLIHLISLHGPPIHTSLKNASRELAHPDRDAPTAMHITRNTNLFITTQ